MSLSLKDFEIMAPVGSRESLAAAIQAGADSIYFGIENLNMRARSANTFTIDDLREIARTCDEHGMKSYLTVNTIIYDKDIPLMHTIVDAAKEAGISAVIAADVAVMNYARQIGQEVHLSTQLNISNAEALKFYAQFADVVVLARELNLEQVAEIYRQIQEEHICGPSGEQLRIEMFCHGALCMAVSGKCYLSLHEMNHSANRGACMQVCPDTEIHGSLQGSSENICGTDCPGSWNTFRQDYGSKGKGCRAGVPCKGGHADRNPRETVYQIQVPARCPALFHLHHKRAGH